ncbi:MAG TPA: glycosyltransferase, partial [Thermoanaerobaculia bacterium]|nr:glycosyltransferase [Thermoanaerobaculia bacterium]
LGLFAVLTASVWLLSLFTAQVLPGVKGVTLPIQRLRRAAVIPKYQARAQQFLLKKERNALLALIARDNRIRRARAARPPIQGGNIVAAFYALWLETGIHSLEANAGLMTHLMPAWVHLNPDGKSLDFRDWDPNITPLTTKVVEIARVNNLNIVPVFSNAQMGAFDAGRLHAFLSDPKLQDSIDRTLLGWIRANRFQGINVDFENLGPQDERLYIAYLRRLKKTFEPGLVVSADLEVSHTNAWRTIASICDYVVVMAYNEHGESSKPGAIASMDWYGRQVLARAVSQIPREKLVVGLANFGYDWTEGETEADSLTYQNAIILAEKYHQGENPKDIVDFDDKALNPTFTYEDDDGKQHEVWFLDAVTVANQWVVAQDYEPRGVALWVLGSIDPSVWNFVRRDRLNAPVDLEKLETVQYPRTEIDFEGDGGEIAHVEGKPGNGLRSLEIDAKTGIAVDEAYLQFPQPTVILRSGYKPKMIALTIDDGPSAPYTGEVLDELKALDVKATFFLIGENAERYPSLVRRIWNEGHEIGNHSYTHPNTGAIPDRQARLELTATQRVIQTLLHRSTLLFRPPYNADAEPTTVEEVHPIEIASELNYITVLEFIDSQDWNIDTYVRGKDGTLHRRNADDMLAAVLDQIDRERGSNILLHDGGGDRSATVKLIPMLVRELRKRGYTFVTISQLLGVTRDQVNPPLKQSDTWMMASDRIVFESIYLSEVFLRLAFIAGIVLGGARVLFVTVLALIAKAKERRRKFDAAFHPPVTVVIAAYNEGKVIARTIRAVLASRYEPLDVIVVDDGSQDDTSAEVVDAFGDNPNVRLIRQDNAGKAAALNRGIAEARGEIIIALDADTIFARHTIPLLIRHFADPLVGAIAGNVKVGNRINPLTYWQSIEYVTSQNLDRRAYDVLNSVTVVPGAVGAWRREAIVQAGGYSTDTMAEDMDLTWRIRRIGYRIETDSEAIGYTEVPDTFRALFRQRFRWAFGTLQCLWKHRRAVGRYGWFGRVMLPSLWLFQVAFQTLSPLIDLEILWSVGNVIHVWMRGHLTGDWQPMPQAMNSLYLVGVMYAFFFVVELIGAAVAFRLDREDGRVLVWLFWQRFLYRQLMYAVLLKSIKTAISGIRAGWGKLDRKGTVELVPEPTAPLP